MTAVARARDADDARDDADDAVARALRMATARTSDARANDARGRRRRLGDRGAFASEARGAPEPALTPRGRAFEALPMDWSLKSSARWTSESSLRWISSASATASSEGLRAYSGGASVVDGRTAEETQRAFARASYSCAFPGEALSDEQCAAMRATASGGEWMKRRESIWADALVSLYGLLKVRQCFAFYVVYRERTVLFCAPGVGAVDDCGYAVVANSSAKFRRVLLDAAIDFTSADEEAAAIERAKKEHNMEQGKVWRPEDELASSRGFLDEGDGTSRAADNADMTAQLAKMDAPSASRRRAADTIVCRGAIAVHGLLNVLLEAAGVDPGTSDNTPCDVPLLLAPVPFSHSSMKPLGLKVQANTTAARVDAPRTLQSMPSATLRTTYTAETERNDFIPPWTLARVCAAISLNHDEYSLLCTTCPHSVGLNTGVAAARSATPPSAAAPIRSRDYYEESEVARIASSPPLGASVIARVQYTNKTYYVA